MGLGTLLGTLGITTFLFLKSDETLSINASFILASTAWLLFSVASGLPFALWA